MSLKVLIKIFLGSAKLSVNKFISDETFSLSFSQTFLYFIWNIAKNILHIFWTILIPPDPSQNLSDCDGHTAIADYSRIISDINFDVVLSLFEEKQSTLI